MDISSTPKVRQLAGWSAKVPLTSTSGTVQENSMAMQIAGLTLLFSSVLFVREVTGEHWRDHQLRRARLWLVGFLPVWMAAQLPLLRMRLQARSLLVENQLVWMAVWQHLPVLRLQAGGVMPGMYTRRESCNKTELH